MSLVNLTHLTSSPLTALPQIAANLIPSHVIPVLSSLGIAARPALSSTWQEVAGKVGENWSDGDSNRAATSLSQAAIAAADLEQHAGSIDQAIAEGTTAIAAAIADIAAIVVEFIQKSVSTLAGGAITSPASLLSGASAVSAHAISAVMQIQQRLAQLETQLQGPLASLQSTIAAPSKTPTAPASAPQSALAPASSVGSSVGNSFGSAITESVSGALPGISEQLGITSGATSPAATTENSDTEGPLHRDAQSGHGTTDSTFSATDKAPTPQAQQAVQHALSAVGTPYQWGGNSPGVGLDCSGLTHWAYGQAGVDIPRVAEAQAVGRQVSQDELLPGDLVVWSGHVAMVVGDGMMVEAGDPVQVNPIRTSNIGMEFKGFYRPTA